MLELRRAFCASVIILVCNGACWAQSPNKISHSQRALTGRVGGTADNEVLWYSAPAKIWTDALAIGNGRFGAMVFADPVNDRYQINDITVWSGGPQPNADRKGAYLHLPEIREALNRGDYATAQKLVSQYMTTNGTGDSEYWPSYETLGDI